MVNSAEPSTLLRTCAFKTSYSFGWAGMRAVVRSRLSITPAASMLSMASTLRS